MLHQTAANNMMICFALMRHYGQRELTEENVKCPEGCSVSEPVPCPGVRFG